MKSGKLFVFEGINGCGKGVQLSRFEDFIYDSGRHVLTSRIRTPNELDENGRLAREMLKSDGDPVANGLKAVEYFGENHRTTAKHIEKLRRLGHDVIEDRNYLSTFSFQHAQGISYNLIFERLGSGMALPDLTFIFDLPAEIACERLSKRDGKSRRKFDSNQDFLEKARQNYLELPNLLSEGMGDKSLVVINGHQPIEAVWKDVKKAYNIAFKDA